jgi:hypothetical protein
LNQQISGAIDAELGCHPVRSPEQSLAVKTSAARSATVRGPVGRPRACIARDA